MKRRGRQRLVQLGLWASLLLTGLACSKGSGDGETGLLLHFENVPEAPVPDEIRLSIYDQGGRLFADERVPQSGPLTPKAPPVLGTLLVYPGDAQGPLRLYARGLRAGQRVSEAAVNMIQLEAKRVVDVLVRLSSQPLGDGDGDGVPDEIDDCQGYDPAQAGCAGVDGGASDGPGVVADALPGERPTGDASDASAPPLADGPLDGSQDTPSAGDAASDRSAEAGAGLGNGQPCSAAGQCASGNCVDSVCCNERCEGKCQACNKQPGICTKAAAGTDPEFECGLYTCNGQGTCSSSCQSTCSNECGPQAFCFSGRCVSDLAAASPCVSGCQCVSGSCSGTLCN